MSQPTKKIKITATELLDKVLNCTKDEKTKADIMNAFADVEKDQDITFSTEITEKFKEACLTLKRYIEGSDDMDLNQLKELCTIFHGYAALSKPNFFYENDRDITKLISNQYFYHTLLACLIGSQTCTVMAGAEFKKELEVRLGKEVFDFLTDDSSRMRMLVLYMGFFDNKEALLKLAKSLEFEFRHFTSLKQMQMRKLITDIWRYSQALEKVEQNL